MYTQPHVDHVHGHARIKSELRDAICKLPFKQLYHSLPFYLEKYRMNQGFPSADIKVMYSHHVAVAMLMTEWATVFTRWICFCFCITL